MNYKVLVIGKNGQLGQSLQKYIYDYRFACENKTINSLLNFIDSFQFYFVGRDKLDLVSNVSIDRFFNSNGKFDAIINAAAYTNVDKAEKNKQIADQLNHLAVNKLAQIVAASNTFLIHISTDYIFDGELRRPYIEIDTANPINYYGLSKLKGEQAILNNNCCAAIIRTSWLYSEFGNNFVKTMLKLGMQHDNINVVSDQIGSPTYAGDLANAIINLLNHRFNSVKAIQGPKVYHFANSGVCSRYEFAKEIFKQQKIKCQIKAIKTIDYMDINLSAHGDLEDGNQTSSHGSLIASRPIYSALNSNKIQQELNIEIFKWSDSLKKCFIYL